MIIRPKTRGFICITAHPQGCAAHVQQWIDFVRASGPVSEGPKRVLVVGSSTGYGLASRVVSAFGCRASTLSVYFEKPSEPERLGTAGWYNTIAFERAARAEGLYAEGINGDAFSDSIKQQAVDQIRKDLGQIDLLIYSLASPRRTHPKTGVVSKSVLKPIGQPYSSKTVDTDKWAVNPVLIEPATEQEVADTVSVMGGEDWGCGSTPSSRPTCSPRGSARWRTPISDPTSPGPSTATAPSAGPRRIWRRRVRCSRSDSRPRGRAYVSVNKALVTQASSAIPVVPLYISLLYRVMKEKGLHEGCIEQIRRLFGNLYGGAATPVDADGRIRIDDWEMRPDVQQAVAALWPQVTTENLQQLADTAGYREEFLKLFGFGLPGIDYDQETEPHVTR